MSAKGVGHLHFIDGIIIIEKYLAILERSIFPTMLSIMEKNPFQQNDPGCHMLGNGSPSIISSPALSCIKTI